MKSTILVCCQSRSRHRVLLAILVVLCLQLFLWVGVLFQPATHITIYLDDLDIKQNQLDFSDALALEDKQRGHFRKAVNETYRINSKHKSIVLARVNSLKHKINVQEQQHMNTKGSLMKNGKLILHACMLIS